MVKAAKSARKDAEPGNAFIEARSASNQIGSADAPAAASADSGRRSPGFLEALDKRLSAQGESAAPKVGSFREYLEKHAQVPLRGGAYGAFSFEGRAPLEFIVWLIDLVIANCLHDQTVTIDGVTFGPGKLKGATISVGGGAQFGKTVLVLNFLGFATFIEFVNFGYYTPDQELLAKIVDTKFRPDVIDQQPWMASMISIGKAESASGKAVNRKNSFQVSDGARKAFGHFCGLQKPTTTISLDAAALDEVDDIPAKNMGYVAGRMTGSPLAFTVEIGTQRVAGAGQNARVKAGSFHVRMYRCPGCGQKWCLEEEWPRIVRVKSLKSKVSSPSDPSITPEMGHDREADYYCACPECGHEIDRDAGTYEAKNPHRVKDAHFSVRVSQLNISAISLQEIVGAWFAAMADPSGDAMVAFYCDRIGIPNAGAAQPITQTVLDDCRKLGLAEGDDQAVAYSMSLSGPDENGFVRLAGMDMGPRCWLWVDEVRSPLVSACVWAEMIASGSVPKRLPALMQAMGISCVFLDAGGEPDLTKRLVLSLNGLEDYRPPMVPQAELLKMSLSNLGVGVSWDGERARWKGIKAAAVLFVSGEARGVQQTIGFTQDGLIYPLVKCARSESIQMAVNDFLTPAEGVLEMVGPEGAKRLRNLRRARLPNTYIGPGVSQAVLDGHLLNLRKERDPRTGAEDWIEKVENHLGLAKTYARLTHTVVGFNGGREKFVSTRVSRPPLRSYKHHRGGIAV